MALGGPREFPTPGGSRLRQPANGNRVTLRAESVQLGYRGRLVVEQARPGNTRGLLLDEPITYLDLAHQIEVLDLIHRLHIERGTTVVMVPPDLDLAALFSG